MRVPLAAICVACVLSRADEFVEFIHRFQVQDVQETHETLTKATAILEQILAPEEDRDLMLLQTVIHEGRSVNLTIPL